MGHLVNTGCRYAPIYYLGAPVMVTLDEFADRVEKLIRSAERCDPTEHGDFTASSLHEPLLEYVTQCFASCGQQNPHRPGQVRIDMGEPQPWGGLAANSDAILVIDFDWTEEGDRFFAKYNLADELLRYAEIGEQGWDIARQIDQLQRTITRLRETAKERSWALPPVV